MTISRAPKVRCDHCWTRTEQGAAWMEDGDFQELLRERGWTRAPHATAQSIVQDVCPDCSPQNAAVAGRTPNLPLAPIQLAKVPQTLNLETFELVPSRQLVSVN